MTEDTADPVIRLRKLWAEAVMGKEYQGQCGAFNDALNQIEAEHAEVILALEELVGMQATTIGGVMAALGQAKAVLNRVGDNKAAARIKLAALSEVSRNLEGVELKADDMMAIAVKSVVYRLKHQCAEEAGDE